MGSGRELSDWVSTYLKYTENTEPPISYHVWTAISMIAGALQRRVYMKWGHDTIYPNLYIVLVGPSGRARKGTAMNIGKDILKDIGISTTSESITREALIRDMKDAITTFTDPDGGVKFHCSLTTISEELSVFLGQNDVKFLADLTDWYDSRDSWTYRTKGAGTDKIQGVCFNLLGATAPDWLQSILPQEAVGGGFTSRIIFVLEENKGKTVPEPTFSDYERDLRKSLKHDLEYIATLAGEMTFSLEARQFYIQWYSKHEKLLEEGGHGLDDPRFAGYLDRRSTHMRKVAMVLCAARTSSKIIEVQDLDRADKLLAQAEKNMPKVFGGLGTSQYAAITNKIINLLEKQGEIKRSDLMRRFYRDLDPTTLEVVETTMRQMKIVQITKDPGSNEVTYKIKRDKKKEDKG